MSGIQKNIMSSVVISPSVETTDGTCRSMSVTAFGRLFTVNVDDTSLDHGLMLWDASVAFLRYLEANPRECESLRNARILEVGAGTGLLGIALAHCVGARVVMTDLTRVCGNLAANVTADPLKPGASGSLSVVPFDWCDADGPRAVLAASDGGVFDAIIGTDVAYSEALNPTLLSATAACARASEVRGTRCTVYFANELRCELAQGVFDRVAPTLFVCKRVPAKQMPQSLRDQNMILFKMRLLPSERRSSASESTSSGSGSNMRISTTSSREEDEAI